MRSSRSMGSDLNRLIGIESLASNLPLEHTYNRGGKVPSPDEVVKVR
jgi:hypothetical protein